MEQNLSVTGPSHHDGLTLVFINMSERVNVVPASTTSKLSVRLFLTPRPLTRLCHMIGRLSAAAGGAARADTNRPGHLCETARCGTSAFLPLPAPGARG